MEPGTLVYDRQARRVGEYQGTAGPHVMLRPVGGGREWEADPAAVRAATPEERLRAGVRAANDRSRPSVDMSRPPAPLPDCVACAELAAQRAVAQAAFDGTAETDANVLLRRHQGTDHAGVSAGGTTTGWTAGGPGPSPR